MRSPAAGAAGRCRRRVSCGGASHHPPRPDEGGAAKRVPTVPSRGSAHPAQPGQVLSATFRRRLRPSHGLRFGYVAFCQLALQYLADTIPR